MQALSFNNLNTSQQTNFTRREAPGNTTFLSTLLSQTIDQEMQHKSEEKENTIDLQHLFQQVEQVFPNEMEMLKEKLEEGDLQSGLEILFQLFNQLQSAQPSSTTGSAVQGPYDELDSVLPGLSTEKASEFNKKLVQLFTSTELSHEPLLKVEHLQGKYEDIVKKILQALNKVEEIKNSSGEFKKNLPFFSLNQVENGNEAIKKSVQLTSMGEEKKGTSPLVTNITEEPLVVTEQKFLLHVQNQGKKIDEAGFVKDLSKIINTSHLHEQNGQKKLLIRLFPENLGYLRIELIQKQEGIVARIVASSEASRKMLQNQLNDMKQQLGVTQLTIEKVELQGSYIQQEKMNWKQQEHQQQHQHQQQQKEESKKEKTMKSFIEELLKIEE